MRVRLKKWSIQGEPRWVVEWTLARKRTRRYFTTTQQAEAEKANVEQQFTGSGDVWMGLTAAERGEILAVWDEVCTQGLTLRDVWEESKRRPKRVSPVRKPLRIAIEEVILCGLVKWHQDILRHTAASHLLALYQDAPKVALLLGTSVPMLLKHYRGLVDAEEARDFWSFLPPPSGPQVSRAPSEDGTGTRAG